MSVRVPVNQGQSVSKRLPCASSLGERARNQLLQSPYHAVRHIRVEERYGEVTLSGRLPNFYLKQMAQTAVAKVEGVASIVNRIDVAELEH